MGMKCEICGGIENVKKVGSTSYWCNNCIKRGLEEANEMNEVEIISDEIEQWLLNTRRKFVNTSTIQLKFKLGLIKTNKALEQLIQRNIISFNEKLRRYDVIGK